MIVGIPKEIKNNENRVSITPSGAMELIRKNHQVIVQSAAGLGSGINDDEYIKAGAKIVPFIEDIYHTAEMIVKIKEPIEKEYHLIKENQLLFTYFHFASYKPLFDAMIKSKSICLAYETVKEANGSLPLLIPMSEIAGRMATQEGAKYLEKPLKGRGILLGGVSGVKPAKVLVLGGGIVGTEAAKIAAGMGAQVTIMDINLSRLRELDNFMPSNVITLKSNKYNILQEITDADLIIGAVLITGAKAPHLITREMLKKMKPGTVLIDVAVDQGGCIETCKPTTHDNPTFIIDDIVHYCVANMPGAVPYTATTALTNATLPYILDIAEKGWEKSCKENKALAEGLNIIKGKVVNEAIANAFRAVYTPLENYL